MGAIGLAVSPMIPLNRSPKPPDKITASGIPGMALGRDRRNAFVRRFRFVDDDLPASI